MVRPLNKLERLAYEIAITTPARFSPVGYFTNVRRDVVADIRRELEAVGIDWRVAHKAIRTAKESRKC